MRLNVIVGLMLLLASGAWAVDTGTVTIVHNQAYPIKYVEFTWTSNPSGDVEKTMVAGDNWVSGELMLLVTDPSGGLTIPTDSYDITCEVSGFAGLDILGGVGANRSQTNTQQAAPVVGTYFRPAVTGLLVFKVATAGNAKSGVARLYYK
jgi:hypothetical protein